MNKSYNLKLDLQFRCNNQTMKFNQFDNNTSDFFIKISNGGKSFDTEKVMVVLAAIKPSGKVTSQFIEVENGIIYADLKPSMRDEIGTYTAQAMLILEDERAVTDTISYEVNESKIISAFIEDAETQEDYTLLTDMISRLSSIEINEDNRENNFNDIKEQFEIIKNNHNELVASQTSKRVDEIIQPVVEENVKKHTEKVINELSDKVVIVDSKIEEVEEFIKDKNNAIANTIDNANIKIDEAINKIPPKSELVGEKGDKGDKGEHGLQGIQGPIGPIGPQGIQGEKGDTPSIAHLETTVLNKVNEIETRFNTLTSSKQQSSEVIDARDGEASLKARLDRDIEKTKEIYVGVEGGNISTDSSNGYAKDIEIKGNTVQDINQAGDLSDIRSVGDKVEGQELYKIDVVACGKNLFNPSKYKDIITNYDYIISSRYMCKYIKLKPNTAYTVSAGASDNVGALFINVNREIFRSGYLDLRLQTSVSKTYRTDDTGLLYIGTSSSDNALIELLLDRNIQIEEDTLTPYEPYQEDKLTILSPVQLEKVGDVADRIICKDGVWGVEKNVATEVQNNVLVNTRTNSEFMPLPHDQQIKLRTFANKTNIHFETEVEGTIKAQVPKSLGAAITTLTEQIDNLNKKVFKIEEIDQVQQDMLILESDMRIIYIELALMEHMPITLNLAENSMLRSATYFNFLKNHIVNKTYSKDYLENVMNKYLTTNRLTQEEYDELYKMLYPPVYDIALPIE